MTAERVFFLLIFAALLLTGCQDGPGKESRASSRPPDQEIERFALTQTRDGEKVWTLSAGHASVYEDAGRVEMTGVRVVYFDGKGGVRSTLTAADGILMRRTNDMEAMGNVVLTAADGTRLTTEKLSWTERTGKIESDRLVRVVQGEDVFTGVGLEADPDLKNIKVKSEFKAYVLTPERGLVEEH
jgi:LPS export ABC transporter protein LptC